MEFQKLNDGYITISFTDDELLLVSDMIANTFTGGFDWIIPAHEYQPKFGISLERAEQMSNSARRQWKNRDFAEPVVFTKEEVASIAKMIDYMLSKWDEGDFETIVNIRKTKVASLLMEFRKQIGS